MLPGEMEGSVLAAASVVVQGAGLEDGLGVSAVYAACAGAITLAVHPLTGG
jgi:hypothetical protein